MRWPRYALTLVALAGMAGAALRLPAAQPAAQSGQPAAQSGQPNNAPDTALMMSGNNVSVNGNFYLYYTVSKDALTIRPGDRLEYDIFIPAKATGATSGADLEWTDGSTPLRDLRITDTDGQPPHPHNALNRARGKWYHRTIPLDLAAGKTIARWLLVFEGDEPGSYAVFLDNFGVHHADDTWTWAYRNGELGRGAEVSGNNGYSREVVVRTVDRAWVTPQNADKVVTEQLASFARARDLSQYQNDLEYVEKFAKGNPEGKAFQQYIDSARDVLKNIQANPNMSNEDLQAQLHQGRQHLAHTHPMMRAYTGYLVGHSHIDFQWLWEWPESLEICRATFSTVANLMDEFPGFAFSQSSSSLYKTTQQYYPDVFARIQQKVKKGTWDIVGGRVCEGDTNMVSPESHARQFLLGQRYFRQNFGRVATVGWEPDTFGHTWSMPQILKMAGIDNYYFCRGGKGQPLFWWEGPDGTKVLTFDEPASGSWYNGPLTNDTLNEIFPWRDKTGLKDILWVYGVGDHGGGVTREDLRTAKDWMSRPFMPSVKFSTAGKFFDILRKQDLSKIPTITDELNGVFEGCYTTHADMKRLNRDAENITTSAETVSAIASIYGQPYPRQTFDDNWEAIVFNHHHDTLPGSAIHESYVKSRNQLNAVIATSKNIAADSLQFLATFMSRQQDMYNVVVFNPLGWTHSGQATIEWPFVPGDNDTKYVAVSPSGEAIPVTIVRGRRADNADGSPKAIFTAKDVPGFGYRVFGLRPANDTDRLADRVTVTPANGAQITMENARLRVTVDERTGLITSLFDKRNNRETIAQGGTGNRLEIWHESAEGLSAWTIGRYTGHEALDGPATIEMIENTPGRAVIQVDRTYQNSHFTQQIALRAGADQVDSPVWADWQEVGSGTTGAPFLKVATDVAGSDMVASYEIPFATIRRPVDGKEVVALKSADLSGADGGLTILNDSKSGHAAEGNTLRVSLLHASDDPDAMPDQREHFINLAIAPHAGGYGAAQVREGFAFNQQFLTARVPPSSDQKMPLEKSFVTVAGDTVVSTVVKRAEDDARALVVRFYEANGGPASVRIATSTPEAPVIATQWVNFIEDPLAAKTTGATAAATLHKYEIRNAMLFQARPATIIPGPVPTMSPAPVVPAVTAPAPAQGAKTAKAPAKTAAKKALAKPARAARAR